MSVASCRFAKVRAAGGNVGAAYEVYRDGEHIGRVESMRRESWRMSKNGRYRVGFVGRPLRWGYSLVGEGGVRLYPYESRKQAVRNMLR
jgi:hypothetical protein